MEAAAQPVARQYTLSASICGVGQASQIMPSYKNPYWPSSVRTIQKIAQTIAGRYSLELGFDGKDAEIVKREQKATDSSFLDDLCKDYGLILKAYSKKLWIYDREAYKKKKAAATIDRTDIVPGSFNFNDGFDGTYTHGIWEYSNQKKKIKIRAEIGKSGRTKRISKYLPLLYFNRLIAK